MSLSSRWTSSLMRTVRFDINRPFSQRSPDLLGFVALDDVADLVGVDVAELDAALEAGPDFVGVVLEALERRDPALVDDLLASPEAGRGVPVDLSLGDEAARDEALGQREHRPDFRGAELHFLQL